MSSDNERGDRSAETFDVVLMHGPTDDGEGAQVLRARPGRLEVGEVRPVEHGRPIAPGAQMVRLSPRKGEGPLFDVHVEYEAPGAPTPKADTAAARKPSAAGPAQVATRAYRDSWERTFGGARRRSEAAN